jgi:Sulfotransferase domain
MIFGIGLSKTGTTSLYAALHELGYRAGTYGHMAVLGLQDWFRGDFTKDYLEDYDAVTDLPIGVFYARLDKRYPGSKFILTVRNVDDWIASARKQFSRNPNPPTGFKRDVRLASYGITGFDEDRYRFVYTTHLRNVKQYFRGRPEQLLVMNIAAGDGWEKLCPFLGQKIPNKPFPNVQPGWRPSETSRAAKAAFPSGRSY